MAPAATTAMRTRVRMVGEPPCRSWLTSDGPERFTRAWRLLRDLAENLDEHGEIGVVEAEEIVGRVAQVRLDAGPQIDAGVGQHDGLHAPVSCGNPSFHEVPGF